jgi:hypothetical protein
MSKILPRTGCLGHEGTTAGTVERNQGETTDGDEKGGRNTMMTAGSETAVGARKGNDGIEIGMADMMIVVDGTEAGVRTDADANAVVTTIGRKITAAMSDGVGIEQITLLSSWGPEYWFQGVGVKDWILDYPSFCFGNLYITWRTGNTSRIDISDPLN